MHYRNPQFEEFYNGWARNNYENTWPDIVRVTREKFVRYGLTYFWIGALLAVPAVPFLFRNPNILLPLVTFLLLTALVVVVNLANTPYSAPLTRLAFSPIVQSVWYT